MSVRIDQILHSEVTNFPGHTKVGAEVIIDQGETLRENIEAIRDLAHELVFVRGKFNEGDPSATEATGRLFPEAGFNDDSQLWVLTGLPHTEIIAGNPTTLDMAGREPVLERSEIEEFLTNNTQLDHIVVLKTLALQREFRENVTAITHFPAVVWSMRNRMNEFISSLEKKGWKNDKFTNGVLRSL